MKLFTFLALTAVAIARARGDPEALEDSSTPEPPPPSEEDPVAAPASTINCELRPNCPTTRDPVCASDGHTYTNACEFESAYCLEPNPDFTIVTPGPCPDDADAWGDVVAGPVEAYSESIIDAIEGPVGPSGELALTDAPNVNPYCALQCPIHNVAPVCGTDGVSYINECYLLLAKCTKPDLNKQYDGLCVAAAKSLLATPLDVATEACNPMCQEVPYAAVCGSDGLTYANQCLLDYAACKDPRVRKLADGKCAENMHKKIPSVEGGGGSACVPTPCPTNEALVCGSDGYTYVNACMLGNAQCLQPDLVVAHAGKCGAETVLTCRTLSCPSTKECREEEGTEVAYCADICTPERCGPHEVCELLEGECRTAPCSPIATCVPKPLEPGR